MKKRIFSYTLMLVFLSFSTMADQGKNNSVSLGDLETPDMSEELMFEEDGQEHGKKSTLRGSSALAAGTCYQFSNCSGLSVHVFNKSLCPADTRSFIADYANFGCEPYWKY